LASTQDWRSTIAIEQSGGRHSASEAQHMDIPGHLPIQSRPTAAVSAADSRALRDKDIQRENVLAAAAHTAVHRTDGTSDAHRSPSVRRFLQAMGTVRLSLCTPATRDAEIERLSERLARDHCKLDRTFALKDSYGKPIRGDDGHPLPDPKGVAELLRASLKSGEHDLLYMTVISSDGDKPVSTTLLGRLADRLMGPLFALCSRTDMADLPSAQLLKACNSLPGLVCGNYEFSSQHATRHPSTGQPVLGRDGRFQFDGDAIHDLLKKNPVAVAEFMGTGTIRKGKIDLVYLGVMGCRADRKSSQ
jgi:hypothetical protein